MKKYVLLATLALLFALSLPLIARAQETPSAAYMAMQAAMKRGNLDEMAKYMTSAKKTELDAMRKKPDYNEEKLIKLLQMMNPSNLKIERQDSKGDKVILVLSGMAENWLKPGTMEPNYGRALFVKENGEWKMDKENWSNQPYEKWSSGDRAPFEL
jgi:hypothetical protein